MFEKINDSIIIILGIDKLPVDEQKDTMEKLGAIVYQEVMLRVLEVMSDEDKNTFENIVATNPDPESMFKYLAEKVPNIDEIVKEEAIKLRDDSANIMGAIGQ